MDPQECTCWQATLYPSLYPEGPGCSQRKGKRVPTSRAELIVIAHWNSGDCWQFNEEERNPAVWRQESLTRRVKADLMQDTEISPTTCKIRSIVDARKVSTRPIKPPLSPVRLLLPKDTNTNKKPWIKGYRENGGKRKLSQEKGLGPSVLKDTGTESLGSDTSAAFPGSRHRCKRRVCPEPAPGHGRQ